MIPQVGLTGGIGSGKSAVAKAFKENGVETIDADCLARELTSPGTTQFDEIIKYFGARILDLDGSIDRKKLGTLVFADINQRKRLESILHPAIKATIEGRCKSFHGVYCVVEIPLLIETGQWKDMDRVLVVSSTDENRIKRLKNSRNMSLEKIQSILAIQMQDEERYKYADDIIENNLSLNEITTQANDLHQHYLRIFKR